MTWARGRTPVVAAAKPSALGPQTVTAVLGGSVSVGDVIICSVYVSAQGLGTSPTLSDQLGNSYPNPTFVQTFAGGATEFGYSLCNVTVAGTPQITLSVNEAANLIFALAIKADHFTGSTASSALDGTGATAAQTNPGTGTDAITTGTGVATTTTGDLTFGAVFVSQAGIGTVGGTGYSGDDDQTWTGIGDINTEFLTQSSAGVIAATWTNASFGGSDPFYSYRISITPGGTGGAITDSDAATAGDAQSWDTPQSTLVVPVTGSDSGTLTEAAVAGLTGTQESVTTTEALRTNAAVAVGDSGALIESASPFVGHAIVSSDTITLVDPGITGVFYQDVESGTLTDASAPAAAVFGTDTETLADVATAASKSAGVITDTDGATLHELASATLATSAADTSSMAEAIAQLLASLSTVDSESVGEIASPSFGGISFVGEPLGLATIGALAGGVATLPPRLAGLADFG